VPNPRGSWYWSWLTVNVTVGCHTASLLLSSVGAVEATLLISFKTVDDSCSRSTSCKQTNDGEQRQDNGVGVAKHRAYTAALLLHCVTQTVAYSGCVLKTLP
jgi:hypothetical protein